MPRLAVTGSFVLLFAAGIAAAQSASAPATAPPAQQTFGSRATAVVIDVVVRDSRGRPVTGLRAEDFTLMEDGVPQKIGAFVEVAQGDEPSALRANRSGTVSTTSSERPAAKTKDSEQTGPRFLALVFDRLSNEGRGLAYKGALASLETLRDDDFVGVFVADLTLVTIQTYTNDRARLEGAIREVATRATTQFVVADSTPTMTGPASVAKLGDPDPSVPVVASPESQGRPVDPQTTVIQQIAAVQQASRGSWEMLQRDQQGYATTNALLAIVNGLAVLPGRKSLVFFAEGLAIPNAVLPYFQSVVAAANRANVSAYTIDSAGLRVHSTDAVTGRAVQAMGAAGLAVDATGGNLSTLSMLEYNEDVLRKDPRTSLTLLANETGGFLVDNTNDLADALRRVDTDRRFYYLLTYAPTNPHLDETWRNVSVAVPSRRVTIRSRSGYAATASASTSPFLTYEKDALAALARNPAPTDLPVRSAALVFPGGNEARVAVLASTDGGAVAFQQVGDKFRAEFTIVTRILDAKGAVVRKASQPYRLNGPTADVERTRASRILFFRQPSLEPGVYTLEVAVHDALASKAGVRRSSFTVPSRASEGLDVSSLVIVGRAETIKPDERQPDNPLFVNGVVLYPVFGEPFAASPSLTLTCYLSIGAVRGPAPTVEMELLRDSTTVARGPLALPSPDNDGRIRYVGQLSLGASASAPGDYVLRVTVVTSGHRIIREAPVTVAATAGRI